MLHTNVYNTAINALYWKLVALKDIDTLEATKERSILMERFTKLLTFMDRKGFRIDTLDKYGKTGLYFCDNHTSPYNAVYVYPQYSYNAKEEKRRLNRHKSYFMARHNHKHHIG